MNLNESLSWERDLYVEKRIPQIVDELLDDADKFMNAVDPALTDDDWEEIAELSLQLARYEREGNTLLMSRAASRLGGIYLRAVGQAAEKRARKEAKQVR